MDIELNKNAPKFFNRELSWLEFNKRVLSEGEDTSVPLLERLKFLAIVSSNFDEFFMVRVAGLKRMERHKNFEKDPSGRTPRQQLEEISFLAHEITVRQYKCLMEDVLPKLKNFGIEYLQPEKYTAQNKQYLENYFRNEVFPLLTPLRATEERCFPRISNLKIYVAFLLKKTKEDGKRTLEEVEKKEKKKDLQKNHEQLAIVQVPSYLSRIIQIPDQEGRFSFALLEDIIELYGTQLFPGYDVVESLIFKVTRDADFSVDEKRDEDFIQAMEEVLENRESSVPVRLVFFGNPGKIIQKLSKSLSLPGERLGYVLVPDTVEDASDVYAAVAGAGRSLGYVNAPSLFQQVTSLCCDMTADLSVYEENCKILVPALREMGYHVVEPNGAFYLFPRSLEPDDMAFSQKAKEFDLLLVPGSGFGAPGHFRLAYCVQTDMIHRALPRFKALAKAYGLG